MELNNPAERQERRAAEYLSHTADAFSFNPASGLLQPNSSITQNKIQTARNDERLNWAQRLQGIGAAFGVAIGIATLVLLWCTVSYTRKQWETMDSTLAQTRSQAQAAWQSEWYAQKSEWDTRQHFEQDQRPWVGIKGIRCRECVATSRAIIRMEDQREWTVDAPELEIEIVNTGKTPAEDVKVDADFTYEGRPKSGNVAVTCKSNQGVIDCFSPQFITQFTAVPAKAHATYHAATLENIGNIPPGQEKTTELYSGVGSEQRLSLSVQDDPVVYMEGVITYYSPWGSNGLPDVLCRWTS